MNVLDHIIAVTDARPCGLDRWMGHCPCHGSKKNRDFSIRRTDERTLLHCFAGCSFAEVCATLRIEQQAFFFDAPVPRGQRPPPKPARVDRVALAFQFDLAALDRRLRAGRILGTATGLDAARLNENELDRSLQAVSVAYQSIERAELFEGVADTLRLRAFREAR